MSGTITKSNPLKMKLSLKKETLRIIDDSQPALLEAVSGGHCVITITNTGPCVAPDDGNPTF